MLFPHTWNNGTLGVTAEINYTECQRISSNPSFQYFNIPNIPIVNEAKYVQTKDNPIKMRFCKVV
jgi:hypothetical protein